MPEKGQVVPNRQVFLYGTNIDCGSGGSTGDIWVVPVPYKCRIIRVMAFVDDAASSTNATAWVIEWDKRVTAGSDTSRTTAFASLTHPEATVANHLVYEDVADITAEPGDEIVAQLATLDGEATQNVKLGIELEYIPENPANISDMVAA